MSFANAKLPLQKLVFDYVKNGKVNEVLEAVLRARDYNTTIMESDLGTNGKQRQLKINYYPPVCTDDGTCSDNLCSTGTVQILKQQFFDITQCTASAVYQLNKDDIREVDGNYTFKEHAKQQIMNALPTVRKKLATAVAALLVDNAGVLPDGNATQTLPWVDKSDGSVNPMGLWEIERTYRDAGLSDPFIVGGSDVFFWRKAVEIGGLNDQGLDTSKMGRTNAYYDTIINDTYASPTMEHVISFDPSMIKFVAFSENAGMFATDAKSIEDLDSIYWNGGSDYVNGSLVDPITGLLWDLDIKYDNCNKYWTFQWRLTWDIFIMPNNVCLEPNVNGIMHWKTCPQVEVTCPAGSVIQPEDETLFSCNVAALTFPYYVAKLEIGGQTSYPGTSVANAAALKTLFNENFNGIVFTSSGTFIQYTGYQAISGQLNDTNNIQFV